MKPAGWYFTALILSLAFLAPVAALADDKEDLEATMTVLDDPSDLDDAMRRLEAPDESGAEDLESGDGAERDAPEPDDGFLHDDVYDDDELEDEDDFEEGEDIDDDAVGE